MVIQLYLAHPLDSRKYVRKWELDFEKLTGIILVNPFYDIERIDVDAIDAGREKYTDIDHIKIVERDLNAIDESDGIIAVIDGAKSFGTIMEIYHAYNTGKKTYLIITSKDKEHPWLKYFSTKIFTSFKQAEDYFKDAIHK